MWGATPMGLVILYIGLKRNKARQQLKALEHQQFQATRERMQPVNRISSIYMSGFTAVGLFCCSACSSSAETPESPDAWHDAAVVFQDGDGDGVLLENDCDDENPAVYPGNIEVPYDGLDNDCDEMTRDDDLDEDGWGAFEGDCDDSNEEINPDRIELPGQSGDEDCDGFEDETVEYERDIENILIHECYNCHHEPDETLYLVENSYRTLVGQPSSQADNMNIVEPFLPMESYLWLKLNNLHLTVEGGEGYPMPLIVDPYVPLEDEDLALFEAWILEGCPP